MDWNEFFEYNRQWLSARKQKKKQTEEEKTNLTKKEERGSWDTAAQKAASLLETDFFSEGQEQYRTQKNERRSQFWDDVAQKADTLFGTDAFTSGLEKWDTMVSQFEESVKRARQKTKDVLGYAPDELLLGALERMAQYKKLYDQLDAEIDNYIKAKAVELWKEENGSHADIEYNRVLMETQLPKARMYLHSDPAIKEKWDMYRALDDFLYPEAEEAKQEETKWYQNIFQAPENWEDTFDLFDDGYNFGDLSRTGLRILGHAGETAVGTVADVGLNAFAGAGNFIEGAMDWGAMRGADILDHFGNSDAAENLREFAEEERINDVLDSALSDLDELSILGETSDSLSQTIGSEGYKMLLDSISGGVAGTAIQGFSSAGSSELEALGEGASAKEARLYGLTSMATTLVLERLSGRAGKLLEGTRFSKGVGNWDETLSKGIASSFNKTFLKGASEAVQKKAGNIITYLVKSGGEGVEEWLEAYANAFEKKWIYLEDKEIEEILTSDQAAEDFCMGVLAAAILQGGSLHNANKTGRDISTGLTTDEQTVVDKVYEKELKLSEEAGEPLSNKAKKALYDRVVDQMKKGYISTDAIEDALSAETYKKYTDTTKQKNELQAEYDELYNRKAGDKSDADTDRQAELKKQLDQLDPDQYRTQLDSEMQERLKDSYLAESYNERTRKGEAFKADVDQYKNEYAKKTVQNIMDSGVVNNSNRTHDFVDLLAKISADQGIVFKTLDADRLKETGYGLRDATVNGFYDGEAVTININSSKALNSVVGHEITHAFEGTDFYTPLRDVVIQYAKDTGKYDSHIAALQQIYSGKQGYDTDFDSKVEQELVADLIGDYLFSDPDFVRNLSVQNRNLFLRLFDEIRYLGRLATAGSKEARELEKIKKLFSDAYRETKNTAQPDGVTYSLSLKRITNTDGIVKLSQIEADMGKSTATFINEVNDMTDRAMRSKRKKKIGTVSANHAHLINRIMQKIKPGFSAEGYEMWMDGTTASHIEDRHGYNGKADTSMASEEAKILIPWASQNADDAEFILDANGKIKLSDRFDNSDNSKAPEIRLKKDVNGDTIYVSECVPDSKNKRIWITSAYIKKGSNGQLLNMEEKSSLQPTPEAFFDGNATKDIIDSESQNVNGKMSLSSNNEDVLQHSTNVYGRDVALENREETVPAGYQPDPDQIAPTAEDIAAMEQDKTSQPEDGMEMLYRGLQEISNLKKGVRASKDLGYLLDHGYDWQSVKTALLNIRDNPDQMVNPNSMAEQTARKMLSDAYDSEIYDNEQRLQFAPAPESIKTVKDRNQAKLHNYTTELVNNMQKRDDMIADYNDEISELQAKYDGMKNKTTVAANDLFRRIERKKRLRDNAAASYEKRISDLYNRIEKMSTEEFKTAQQRQLKQEEYAGWAENLVGDTSTWVDKKTGGGYMTNTLRRNLRAIVKDANGKPDYKKADAIYEELQGKYNQHEADLNRELTKLRDKYAKLNITKAEDVYIQMLGEYRHNPSTTLTEDTVKGYYEKHKKTIDTAKVDKIIEMARQDYDSLIQRVNEVLRNQGMKEIPYRKGYFPHFTNDKQGWLGKLLNWKTKNDDIHTDIAGLTEQFEPVRSYQHFNKERKTDITDYSFKKGFDSYSFGALDWIYHIEDIQKRRALENHIRYTHSDEGVKQKVDAIKANESLDADEAQEQIDLVYKEARNPLNNFVIDLRRGTQTLAGKKSSLDREMEYDTNRKIYSTMTNISNRVSANMVAGSFSAALTNFIPITQSWGTVSPLRSMQAMAQTMKSTIRDDGMVDKSTFLTNRLRQAESLNKTGWDKASDKISWLMNAVDSFTSQTVWRSKYDTNIAKGMSESEAIQDADLFAESVLAGRSRGNMPTVFDSKNLVVKMLTAFQLEVANQYGYLFQDMPQDAKNKNIAHLVGKYAMVFVGAYAYNALFSSLTGRTAALDPLRIIKETLKDAGLGDDEEDEDELMWSEIFGNLSENILQEVPFVGGLLGGGRVPISSALPYDNIVETFKGTSEDFEKYVKSTDENMPWYSRPFSGDKEHIRSLTKEWLKPIFYVAFPMGGGQLKKTIEGASMFLGTEDQPEMLGNIFGKKPVSGSYTTSGDLRFPVEETTGNVIQATLFGQWASQNAQDYIDQGRKPLSEKQSEEFLELDIPIQDYWQIRDDLSDMDSLSEKADYIAGLDLSTEQKNVLINNVTDRKEKIDLQDYDQYSGWEEYDFYLKNPEKYDFLQGRNISYGNYKVNKEEFDFAYRNPEKYDFLNENGVAYDDWDAFDEDEKSAWTWAYNNPEKYLLSKSVSDDVARYRRYTAAINNIKSDKDRNGNTVSGSRKEKVIAYINRLALSKEEKMILFKMEYPSYDGDNKKIIAYIKGLDGFANQEKQQMLTELGFTIKNGRVYWD